MTAEEKVKLSIFNEFLEETKIYPAYILQEILKVVGLKDNDDLDSLGRVSNKTTFIYSKNRKLIGKIKIDYDRGYMNIERIEDEF